MEDWIIPWNTQHARVHRSFLLGLRQVWFTSSRTGQTLSTRASWQSSPADMAHLPLFKSSSFHLLVIQVQPRHKLKKPWSHPICWFLTFSTQSWKQNAPKKVGIFLHLGWRLLWNCRGCKYPPQAQHSRFFPHQCLGQKYSKRVDLSLKKSTSLKNLRHFHPISPKRPGWSTRQSQAPDNFASLPPPTNMAPPGKNGNQRSDILSQSANVSPKLTSFLKSQFGIIPFL